MLYNKTNPTKGFSLVEVMVTVAILAVLAVIAAPSFGDLLPVYRANNAAKELESELNLARMRAIAKNIRNRVRFEVGAQQIVIEDLTAVGDPVSPPVKTISFGRELATFPTMKLGRNPTSSALIPMDSADPNSALVEDTSFSESSGSSAVEFPEATAGGGSNVLIFLPNGMAAASGAFFITPLADLEAGTMKTVHTRGIKVYMAGKVKKWRYDDTRPMRWEAF